MIDLEAETIIIPVNDGNRNRLFRLNIKMAYVGLKCAHCENEYASVDNFLGRDPLKGHNDDLVDRFCWGEYVRNHIINKVRKWIKISEL